MSDDKLVMGFRAEVYMSENVDSLTHVTAEDFIMADEFEAAGTLPLTSGRDLRFTQGRVDRAMPDFAHSLRPEAPERMMNPSSDAQIAAAPLQPVDRRLRGPHARSQFSLRKPRAMPCCHHGLAHFIVRAQRIQPVGKRCVPHFSLCPRKSCHRDSFDLLLAVTVFHF